MLMPADKILASLIREFDKLVPLFADAGTDGSGAMSIAHSLRLLQAREVGGEAAIRAQFAKLDAALAAVAPLLGGIGALAAWRRVISLEVEARNVVALEALWQEGLAAAERAVSECAAKELPEAARAELFATLGGWEAADLTGQMKAGDVAADAPENAPVTVDSLNMYLRDRFGDDSLNVTQVISLAGGFGKQTTIFAVEGRSLSGEYVIRRELGGDTSLTNDCHQIEPEFKLIKAVFERGFAAPEVVWLDTEHRLLQGGHFIVMKRSPGKIGGNVFRAASAVPEDLVEVLAGQMAALHNLAPLHELGSLSDSINPEYWAMDRAQAIETYIRGWYDYYLNGVHVPSPAIAALYGWMLNNIPKREGRPSLLHGDIGFHNLLFHEGKVSALLDWEFAHVGDPAEDLGYVRETAGNAMDWEQFMALYREKGGGAVDAKTLHFFRVWAHLRNATAANLLTAKFNEGSVGDLKVTVIPYLHVANFIRAAQMLIAEGPGG